MGGSKYDWSGLSGMIAQGMTLSEIGAAIGAPAGSVDSAVRRLGLRKERIGECDRCGMTFTTTQPRKKYCGEKCAWGAREASRLADPARGQARRTKKDAARKRWREKRERTARRYPDDPHWRERPRRASSPVLKSPEARRRKKERNALSRLREIMLAGSEATDARRLRAKMSYWNWACWICGAKWEDIDHVKPIAAGGTTMISNLRPICGECNTTKGARWPYPTTRSAPSSRGATET